MDENGDKTNRYRQALQAARAHVLHLNEQLSALTEPVAVIGMSCRFPGTPPRDAETPDRFYRQLLDGVDSVIDVPPERLRQWQSRLPEERRPRGTGLQRAALLAHDPYAFDADFFGIPPAEAEVTDPQHRLFLELVQRALWDAGLPAGSEPGAEVGVFCGKSGTDYMFDVLGTGRESADNPYTLTGNMHSALAGRVSYFFDWHGPSLSAEAACATALVAVLDAVQSLRLNACRLAVAGAVNLLLGPTPSHWLGAMHALAPDGRCKAFGAGADGFGRGEGGGVLVLQRLSEARRAGNRIHALILGGAAGADGKSWNFTSPSAAGQRKVIARALRDAGVAPREVAFVETHGTGTPIGDPIEAESLAAAYAPRNSPLLIGSVKSNVAHLEAAAGMAALIKCILSVREGRIPKTLHVESPNPLLDLPALGLALCGESLPWPEGYAARIAGVSGFAITGSLAHLLLADASARVPEEAGDAPRPAVSPAAPLPLASRVLALSAESEDALREMAREALERLEAGVPFAQLCDAAGNARPHGAAFPERLALCADEEDAAEGLRRFLQGKPRRTCVRGRFTKTPPAPMFLYSGQGSQIPGMGRHLYRRFPEFREVLDRCEAIAAPRLKHSLLEVMFAGEDTRLWQTRVSQPLIFSHQMALTALLEARGVVPQAVMGHSVGEYAAACAAGVMDLETGLDIVLQRGELAQSVRTPGGMAAVLGEEAQVEEAIRDFPQVSIAAINGQNSVTLAGEAGELAAALRHLAGRGMESRPMPVSHAFHCALIEPVLPAFLTLLRRQSFQRARLPFLSTALAEYTDRDAEDWAAYFAAQTRHAVRFAQAVQAARETVFLEIAAGPSLSGFGRQICPQATWLFAQNGSGEASASQEQPLALVLARLFGLGITPNFHWLAASPWRPECAPLPRLRQTRQEPPSGMADGVDGSANLACAPVLPHDEDSTPAARVPDTALEALIGTQQALWKRVRDMQRVFIRGETGRLSGGKE
jgi:acyl transferase domain-containing protein